MKSIIFRNAAKKIEYTIEDNLVRYSSMFSCDVINKEVYRLYGKKFLNEDSLEEKFYKKMFKPKRTNFIYGWWSDEITETSQLARQLALLFAAEMVEDGIK